MECRLEMSEEPNSELVWLRIFRCPLGHRSYGPGNPISVIVVEFRRTGAGNMWHFVKTCSQWPTDDFVSVGYLPPEAIVCSECYPSVVGMVDKDSR